MMRQNVSGHLPYLALAVALGLAGSIQAWSWIVGKATGIDFLQATVKFATAATLIWLEFHTAGRIVAIIAMIAMISKSGFAWANQASSCGCFGHVDVQPLYTLLFAICLLVWFAITAVKSPMLRGISHIFCATSSLAVVMAAIGSLSASQLNLTFDVQPDDLMVSPVEINVGKVDGKVSKTFHIRNQGANQYGITRVSAECGCTTVTPSKWTLLPSEEASVEFSISGDYLKTHRGDFRKTARLHLQSKGQASGSITLVVSGRSGSESP